jgi:hypothetical protein
MPYAMRRPHLALGLLDALRGNDLAAMKVWDLCRPFEELRAGQEAQR